MMATYNDIKKRVAYLRGETNYTTAGDDATIIADHINFTIEDIVNRHPFSWNQTYDDLTLVAGVATMPTDYNPHWPVQDARIEGSSDDDDDIFTIIDPNDRDNYSSDEYAAWITRDSTTGDYTFNSKTLTGTVRVYYYFIPTALSAADDPCIVPDAEAVAYLATSKFLMGEDLTPQAIQMKKDFQEEGLARIDAMAAQDIGWGPQMTQGSVLDSNANLQED